MGAKQWTTEEDSLLRDLVASGLTAAQVADKIAGKTRNAIIGRVHRLALKLQHVARGGKPKGQTTKWVRRKPTVMAGEPKKVLAPIRRLVPRPAGRIGIMEIKHGLCRYPIGTPGKSDFEFCGNSSGDGIYCREHAEICYIPLRR